MTATEALPLLQAAYLLQEPVDQLKRAVERKSVDYLLISQGGRKVRALDYSTIVFLKWAKEHEPDLSPSLWQKCYASIKGHHVVPSFVETDVVRAPLGDAKKAIQARLTELRALERRVERREDGEPVFKGTHIEVYRIAALLDGGMTSKEVLRDYPSLKDDNMVLAQAYAALHPKPGRPYPKTTAKSALAKADFSALDLED